MVSPKSRKTIVCTTLIQAPLARCFDLTRSIEFHEESSGLIGAKAVGGKVTGLSEEGDETTWSARFFGMRFLMTTRITEFGRNGGYRESMIKGLPKKFAHEYTFEKLKSSCRITDLFEFESGFGSLGKFADFAYWHSRMTYLVQVRLNYIKAAAESDRWKQYLA